METNGKIMLNKEVVETEQQQSIKVELNQEDGSTERVHESFVESPKENVIGREKTEMRPSKQTCRLNALVDFMTCV